MTNRAETLSKIDLDNLDLSILPSRPVSIDVVDGDIVVTDSDSNVENLGLAGIPAEKTISNAFKESNGDLIVQYVDGSSDLFAGVFKKVVNYSTQGEGLLTSVDGTQLNFSPLPIDASMSFQSGVLSPRKTQMTYENHAKLLWLSPSKAAGRRINDDFVMVPYNHVLIDNIGIELSKGILTLPRGMYRVIFYSSGYRTHNAAGSILSVRDCQIINYPRAAHIPFANSVASYMDQEFAEIEVLEDTGECLFRRSFTDNRSPDSIWNAASPGNIDYVQYMNFSIFSTAEIWKVG